MKIAELKSKIKSKVPKNYKITTNFSSPEFLVQVNNLVIAARPICRKTEVKCEIILDTQFISSGEITYEEVTIIKEILELLEENKKTAISRLKKWTVKEYSENQKLRELQSQKLFKNIRRKICLN